MSTDGWMDKAVVHKYSGVLLGQEKEQLWVSWTEVDEPKACYTEWSYDRKKKTNIVY